MGDEEYPGTERRSGWIKLERRLVTLELTQKITSDGVVELKNDFKEFREDLGESFLNTKEQVEANRLRLEGHSRAIVAANEAIDTTDARFLSPKQILGWITGIAALIATIMGIMYTYQKLQENAAKSAPVVIVEGVKR